MKFVDSMQEKCCGKYIEGIEVASSKPVVWKATPLTLFSFFSFFVFPKHGVHKFNTSLKQNKKVKPVVWKTAPY